MEMERINENTIRVLIENADLEARGISFLDLLGNHKQIESFFYSILEEVDIDEQFQETDPVTFQVLPNRNGLELFISKNLLNGEDSELPELSELINQDSFGDFVKSQMGERDVLVKGDALDKASDSDIEVELDTASPFIEAVVRFASFEDLIGLAKVASFNHVLSNVYQLAGDPDVFFLHLSFVMEELTENQVNEDLAIALEYGTLSNVTPEVLAEYGKVIMEQSALEQINHYFKK